MKGKSLSLVGAKELKSENNLVLQKVSKMDLAMVPRSAQQMDCKLVNVLEATLVSIKVSLKEFVKEFVKVSLTEYILVKKKGLRLFGAKELKLENNLVLRMVRMSRKVLV